MKSKDGVSQTPPSQAARGRVRARGDCEAAAREGSRREVQGWRWPDAAIADRKGRVWARGGCEAGAQEGRRETSTLENTEKALLIILSSYPLLGHLHSVYCGGKDAEYSPQRRRFQLPIHRYVPYIQLVDVPDFRTADPKKRFTRRW
jgi:hypothetical protein